jgi:hypothetical protein
MKRTGLNRKTPMKRVNRKRKAERYEKQFGPKSEWMREAYPRCIVTGRTGYGDWPVDHAHVKGTRAAGADSTWLAPLHREVHTDFDEMHRDAFAEKYGVTKQEVRARAQRIHREWTVINA